jgi:hypothetical protein
MEAFRSSQLTALGSGASSKDKITVRLERRQLELLEGLDKNYGSNVPEKIRFIIQNFFNQNALSIEVMRRLPGAPVGTSPRKKTGRGRK